MVGKPNVAAWMHWLLLELCMAGISKAFFFWKACTLGLIILQARPAIGDIWAHVACQEETALSALYTVYSSSRNAGWGQLDLCLTSGQPFFKLKRKIRKCLEDHSCNSKFGGYVMQVSGMSKLRGPCFIQAVNMLWWMLHLFLHLRCLDKKARCGCHFASLQWLSSCKPWVAVM